MRRGEATGSRDPREARPLHRVGQTPKLDELRSVTRRFTSVGFKAPEPAAPGHTNCTCLVPTVRWKDLQCKEPVALGHTLTDLKFREPAAQGHASYEEPTCVFPSDTAP